MAEIEGLVRALREGDDAAKTAAARQLGFLAFNDAANKALIAKAGGIPPLVQLLRDGSVWGKQWAARALGYLAWSNAANKFLIAEAGGIAPLVELLRDGSAQAKEHATWVLNDLALDDNKALIAEAGGIPPLVELLRDGCAVAMHALRRLTLNNDANAVAIAASIGFEAVVKLARGGSVTVHHWSVVRNAGVPAKRKAALVVAALLRDCVPEFKSAPRDIKAVIGSYL